MVPGVVCLKTLTTVSLKAAVVAVVFCRVLTGLLQGWIDEWWEKTSAPCVGTPGVRERTTLPNMAPNTCHVTGGETKKWRETSDVKSVQPRCERGRHYQIWRQTRVT